jgi:hypothetical protein
MTRSGNLCAQSEFRAQTVVAVIGRQLAAHMRTSHGFGDHQVDAICSLGRSSKGPGTAIGHKGLGFKSVGEISDQPQIFSLQASFQFDSERLHRELLTLLAPLPSGQRFPVYAFPFPVGADDLGPDSAACEELRNAGLTTIIRLPLRDGTQRKTVAEHLVANLLPRLLLFLPGMDSLALEGTDRDFSAEVIRRPDGPAECVLVETNTGSEEWLVYRGSTVPDRVLLEPLGEAWMELEDVKFAVAVPLDDAGQVRVDETYPLHVYFPTDEDPGLHVAVHAEWALSMDRRQLATTPEARPLNQSLVETVADFLAAVVAEDLVQRTGASAWAVEALIPVLTAPVGNGALMRRHWIRALQQTSFLPCSDGTLTTPVDVRLLPSSVPDPEQAHTIAALDERHTLRADLEAIPAVRAFLASDSGVNVMSVAEFVSVLNPPTADSVALYYDFLVSWRQAAGALLLAELKKRPTILTVQGTVLAPGEEPVFFPRARGDSSISMDMPVPIADVPHLDGVDGLLRDLGVRPFEWRELIRDFLIKILQDSEADAELRDRALAGLRAYHRQRLAGSEDLAPVLGRVLLGAHTVDRRESDFRAASRIYFGKEWTGSSDLEVIYGPFGEAEFLDAEVPADADLKQQEMDFYRMLGVEDHPRLDIARADASYTYMVGGDRHPHRGSLFTEWLQQPEVAQAAKCPQGHSASQQLRRSVRLDRDLEVIESLDQVRLIAMWNQFAIRWGTVYEPAMQAVFHCVHQSHSGERDRVCESIFGYALRSRPWVPVDRGGTAGLVRPQDAWIEAAELPRWIRARIPRISDAMFRTRGAAAMAKDLNITDAARPVVVDLLTLLAGIAAEADERGATTSEIDRAARWVQRTLDEALGGEQPHPQPRQVRLLASHAGETSFVVQPPYADDLLLRETWERRIPVLASEADFPA